MAEGELPRATTLWQRLLHVIDDSVNVVVWGHPLDRERVVRHLRNLHRVGERPTYEEFSAYLEEMWPSSPGARKGVRAIWRSILRNPHHKFRVKGAASLALLDQLAIDLAREYGAPPLEWRVLDVLSEAKHHFATATLEDPDYEAFLAARRELRTAMHTLGRVREVRLGFRATGNWVELPADECTPAEMREWRRLQLKYAEPY